MIPLNVSGRNKRVVTRVHMYVWKNTIHIPCNCGMGEYYFVDLIDHCTNELNLTK